MDVLQQQLAKSKNKNVMFLFIFTRDDTMKNDNIQTLLLKERGVYQQRKQIKESQGEIVFMNNMVTENKKGGFHYIQFTDELDFGGISFAPNSTFPIILSNQTHIFFLYLYSQILPNQINSRRSNSSHSFEIYSNLAQTK